jgi:hypothetical protein
MAPDSVCVFVRASALCVCVYVCVMNAPDKNTHAHTHTRTHALTRTHTHTALSPPIFLFEFCCTKRLPELFFYLNFVTELLNLRLFGKLSECSGVVLNTLPVSEFKVFPGFAPIVLVYYCTDRTYHKAVCGGGGGQ